MSEEFADYEAQRWRSMYQRAGSSPLIWHIVAREFIRAANVVHADFRSGEPVSYELSWPPPTLDYDRLHASLTPVVLMYAFAVESLLKAILVAKGENPVASGALDKRFRHHNLNRLAVFAGIKVDPPTSDLLQRLQRVIEAGKYPIATIPSPYAPEQITPDEIGNVLHLLEQLENILRDLTPLVLPSIDLGRLGISP